VAIAVPVVMAAATPLPGRPAGGHGQAEPRDDKGGDTNAVEPGDDKGGDDKAEPGDDKGKGGDDD
jgi:hypothetical protein